MANEKNLIPLNERSQRERKEIARKGAMASNKAQANKKVLKESAKVLLSMPISKEIKAELKPYKLPTENEDYAMAIVVAQLKNALEGDTRAFNAIRDIVGESPAERGKEELEEDDKVININIIPASKLDNGEEDL